MPPASMKTAPKAGLTCPTCGAAVAEGNLFCNNCGTKLAPTPAPAPAPAPAEPAVEELKRSCPNCGTELEPDAAFCFNCGAKLGE